MSGTLHILEAVRELKLSSRIIIAGSSTVYGASTEEWDGPVPEEAALKPVSPYGVSKAATEMRLGFDLSWWVMISVNDWSRNIYIYKKTYIYILYISI